MRTENFPDQPFVLIDRETGKLIDPQPEWKTPNGAEHELKWTPKENGQRIMRETPIGTDGEFIFMLSHIDEDTSCGRV